jgi:hypothetical protein
MSEPTLKEFVRSRMRFSEAWARAEWEIQYGRPQRARKTAHAWVGVIRLSTFGSVEGYTRGFWGHPYEPPKVSVGPAASDIDIDVEHFRVTFLPAGTVYDYPYAHEKIVAHQLGVKVKPTLQGGPRNYYDQRRVRLEQPRVLITWSELGLIYPDPERPPPAYFRLLQIDANQEYEIQRLNTSVVHVFSTEGEADTWIKQRSQELTFAHDQGHARQCRDNACAARGHTYIPRDD